MMKTRLILIFILSFSLITFFFPSCNSDDDDNNDFEKHVKEYCTEYVQQAPFCFVGDDEPIGNPLSEEQWIDNCVANLNLHGSEQLECRQKCKFNNDCTAWLDCLDNCGGEGWSEPDYPETWTDKETGLMWQTSALAILPWEEANSFCEELEHAGFDDWRLPTINELRSIIRGCDDTMVGGACDSSNPFDSDQGDPGGPCYGCYSNEGPSYGDYNPVQFETYCGGDNGIECRMFWSSSIAHDYGTDEIARFVVGFIWGAVAGNLEQYDASVHCVRDASN